MKKLSYILTILFGLLVISLALFSEMDFSNQESLMIFYELRLPRVLLTLIVGALLSLCGLIFQSLFQNELASPYILGISSGASFFVTLAIKFNLFFSFLFFDSTFLFSLFGALISTGVIYLTSRVLKLFDSRTLLLAGVAQSMFFMSGVFLLQFLSNETELYQSLRWSFGSLDIVGMKALYRLIPFFLIALVVLRSQAKSFNLLLLGDEFAKSQGLYVDRFRSQMFLLTSLLVGLCVSEVGPIGFVGLVVPHLSKKILETNRYQELTFYAPLLGGALLCFFDYLASNISLSPIPIGIVTSFVGGPFFFFLLIKKS